MKSIEEIKAKLQKLFAMIEEGSGASEQEVQTAMVKARKLMSEYKISEADLSEPKNLEVIQVQVGGIKFSTQKNPWISNLATVIGNNYCCHGVMYHTHGAKTRHPGFIGFKDDVDLAVKILKYAVDSALAENDRIRKNAVKMGHTHSEATAMGNAYGNGFVSGVKHAFEEQNRKENAESKSFAMVMVEPTAVKEYVKEKCTARPFNTSRSNYFARQFDDYAVKGFKDGKEFNTRSRLNG